MAPAHALPVARVRNMKPVLQIKSKGTANFIMARDKNALRFGDTVRTLAGGKADLIFTNGTQIALRENTQIEIVAPESATQPLVIRVFGALSEVFVRPKGNTQIRTAAAIAAARGTEYLVSLPTEDSAQVTVTEGSVDFSNPQGSVIVAANQQSNARVGSAPTPPVATDVTGLVTWTADITGLPVEFEMPFVSADEQQVAAAVKQRQALVTAQPNNATAHRQLGEALVDAGQPIEALAQFEQALAGTTDATERASIMAGTARARLLRGDTPGSIATYRQALETAPGNRGAQLGLSLALLSAHDFAGARAALPAAGATVADNALPQAINGLISLHQGNPGDAEAQLREALRSDPNLPSAHALLALALLTQNHIPESETEARRAAELQPGSAQVQGTLATVLLFTGDLQEAARAAKRAVEINPESPFALLAQGRISLSQLRTDEARNALGQAQALAPDLPVIPNELGAVYLRLGMLPKAEKAYRRAIELSPQFAEAYNGLGWVLQQEGKTDEAMGQFRQAFQIDPGNAAAHGNLAALYIEQGRLADAEAELQTATAADSSRGILYVRLSEVSLLRNNLFQAQQFARQGVRQLPSSAVAHYQLGRVYLEQNRTAQAEQEFRQAVALDRHFNNARYALGYTQDLVEQGRDRTRVGAASSPRSLGTASAALDVQNLQSPGASESIKAAISDPSVIRSATRSYGDTEVEGAAGSKNANDLEVSHIQELSGRRGVIGATGEYHRDEGRLANSSTFDKRASFIYGQKARNNPSSLFFLGQYEDIDDGLNYDGTNIINTNATAQVRKPLFVVGGNLQHNERSQTRALIQYSDPKSSARGFLGNGTRSAEVSSVNGEVRHDIQFSRNNTLNIGLFGGTRKRNSDILNPILPPVIDQNDAHLYGGYLRDEMQMNSRFRLTGELRVQKLKQDTKTVIPGIAIFTQQSDRTDVLPLLLLEYQLSERTGIRLRARRIGGTFEDFQLLAPTDPFFTSSDSLPKTGVNSGYGTSFELEGDHTFSNSSFLRTGLIVQRLHNALEPFIGGGGNVVNRVAVSGIRTGYEGLINDNTTFFVNVNLNRVRDRDASQQVAESPSFVSEAGIQYLTPQGFFVQPTFIYSSGRYASATGPGPRTHQGGFGLFNARVGKRAGVRSELFAEVLNAFNKQYELFGVERSGRQFRIGAMQRF